MTPGRPRASSALTGSMGRMARIPLSAALSSGLSWVSAQCSSTPSAMNWSRKKTVSTTTGAPDARRVFRRPACSQAHPARVVDLARVA